MGCLTILFIPFLVSVICVGNAGGDDSFRTPVAEKYSVSSSMYLQPFIELTDHLNCREDKCTAQDCGYASYLAFDAEMETQLSCSCHIFCYASGQCCLNFEEVCLSGARTQWVADTFPHEVALIELSTLHRLKSNMSHTEYYQKLTSLRTQLIMVTEERIHTRSYNVISKCSSCEAETPCQVIKELCERTVLQNYEQFVPVFVIGQLFANKYCAQCTPYTDMSNMTIIDTLDVGCKERALNISELFENGNEEEIFKEFQSGNCKVTIPSKIYEARYTLSMRHIRFKLYKRCDTKYRAFLENFNEIDLACRSYSASYAIEEGPHAYGLQNKHCALCNLEELAESQPICICNSQEFPGCVSAWGLRGVLDDDGIPKPFFQLALNFRGAVEPRGRVFRKCSSTEYLDLTSKECVHRECLRGFYKYGQLCLSQERFQFVESVKPKRYHLCVLLDGASFDVDAEKLIRDYENVIAAKGLIGHSGFALKSQRCSNNKGFEFANLEQYLDAISIMYKTAERSTVDLSFIWHVMEDYSSLMELFSKKHPIVKGVVIYYGDENTCPDGTEKQTYNDFSLTWDGDDWLSLYHLDKELREKGQVYFANMALSVNFEDISAGFSIMYTGNGWMLNMTASFCFRVNDTCHAGSQNISTDCLQPMAKTARSSAHPRALPPSWDTIITLMCACLSCTALVSALIIHLRIPEIMQSGDKAFIQLIISLLLAECCLIFSVLVETGDSIACMSLAIAQHFAWLCTFSWTAILSLDLFIAFAVSIKSPMRNCFVEVCYSLFGWGLPFLVVTCCISLHFVGRFHYGGSAGCWIQSPVQLGIAFGLPVASAIAFNITLYIIIVRALHRQMVAASNVGRDYDLKTRFLVYSKMSTIVGFTWIFGFLANINELSFMAYVFSITAALNGLFVSCAFTLSSKSIRLIKERWASFTGTNPAS